MLQKYLFWFPEHYMPLVNGKKVAVCFKKQDQFGQTQLSVHNPVVYLIAL